jgi:hypothetical protein
VPPNSMLPKPGTPAASDKAPGGMLLYLVSDEMAAAQPFDLVVHTSAGALAKLRLPHLS